MESTITSKGQLTLPKSIRDELHLSQGDKVFFEALEEGAFILRPRNGSVQELKGFLKYRGKPASIEDMQRAIEENAG